MKDNLLASYAPLMAHLAGVPGIKKVLPAKDFAELGRKQQPLDGALYVVFNSLSPKSEAARDARLELSYLLVLAKSQLTTPPDVFGQILTHIVKAVNGYHPKAENGYQSATPFFVKGVLKAEYVDAFVYLPIDIRADVLAIPPMN